MFKYDSITDIWAPFFEEQELHRPWTQVFPAMVIFQLVLTFNIVKNIYIFVGR